MIDAERAKVCRKATHRSPRDWASPRLRPILDMYTARPRQRTGMEEPHAQLTATGAVNGNKCAYGTHPVHSRLCGNHRRSGLERWRTCANSDRRRRRVAFTLGERRADGRRDNGRSFPGTDIFRTSSASRRRKGRRSGRFDIRKATIARHARHGRLRCGELTIQAATLPQVCTPRRYFTSPSIRCPFRNTSKRRYAPRPPVVRANGSALKSIRQGSRHNKVPELAAKLERWIC